MKPRLTFWLTVLVTACLSFPAFAGEQTKKTETTAVSSDRYDYLRKVTFYVGAADNNLPIIGAVIMLKGTTNGTVTDEDGKASLNRVPDGYTAVISYIGYITQEIKMVGSSHYIVSLKPDSELLQ